jgi:hypothetical protein
MAWHEAGDLLLGFIRRELGRRRGLNSADKESVLECRGTICSKQAMISHDVMGSRATLGKWTASRRTYMVMFTLLMSYYKVYLALLRDVSLTYIPKIILCRQTSELDGSITYSTSLGTPEP